MAQIPAANGQGNARGLARIYGALANNGKMDHLQLLEKRTLEKALTPQTDSQSDPVLNKPICFGRGFILNHHGVFGPDKRSFGHDGTKGSTAFADPEKGIGFAYVTNQMEVRAWNTRSERLIRALYKALNNNPLNNQ